jgi:hypothetical protein
MVFNVTFNTISTMSWRSVLLVEETGVPRENHRPVASHWQTLSHNVISSHWQTLSHNVISSHWQTLSHNVISSHWQPSSHNVISSTPRLCWIRTHGVCWDWHWLHRWFQIQLPYDHDHDGPFDLRYLRESFVSSNFSL